ncbi:CLUMA_CG010999, isoform A [Clunio marinus]|uniref:CLUMA_CG010999, isoform A n=1 Tax=Clunio marinus TaxID=568069 RepID=A0A1J1IBF7_9DIPT|nr:CLUMA_CG010999, isoform A [Clunio marinus]
MTNKFHKVPVLRTEWEIPEYYDNLSFSHRSAFGIYCIAYDRKHKNAVEIKRWSISSNKETSRKAFLELKMLRHLTHNNIVKLTNSFYKDNKLYLVMDVMQDNLNNIIRAQRLQSDDIRYIIYQISRGLNYLHSSGITHGDLKPTDIGINKDLSIKIIDLNVERPKETDYVLTKWYRAPELLFAWKASTEKVDLWSLGCIMAEFLCGRIIFAGRDHLQQLRLILELLGTPSKEFFNPSCHFCIITQNLITGEKFVRSLPFFRKKSFRRVFDECDDETGIDFLEKLLQLEPCERIDTTTALKHPYLNKYEKDDDSDSVTTKFEDICEVENEDWITCIEQNVDIKD